MIQDYFYYAQCTLKRQDKLSLIFVSLGIQVMLYLKCCSEIYYLRYVIKLAANDALYFVKPVTQRIAMDKKLVRSFIGVKIGLQIQIERFT